MRQVLRFMVAVSAFFMVTAAYQERALLALIFAMWGAHWTILLDRHGKKP